MEGLQKKTVRQRAYNTPQQVFESSLRQLDECNNYCVSRCRQVGFIDCASKVAYCATTSAYFFAQTMLKLCSFFYDYVTCS